MIEKTSLRQISPDKIDRNPENPRLFFRSEEMDTLLASIRRHGILVPITVYEEGDRFVLIDGERRWKTALKLNLPRVPALIQKKPSRLDNLLLMFNIHALREQWDYLTIANKIPSVIELFQADHYGREPTEAELSEITGLTRGQVRRCRFLVDLPKRYRVLLEEELARPKNLQVLSEDFFIEMERALKTVRSRVPAAIPDMNAARDALIYKFKTKTIKNITDFRKLSKIATAINNLGVKESRARAAIQQILDPDNKVSIDAVFFEQFETRYDEKKVTRNVDALYDYLLSVDEEDADAPIPLELAQRLRELVRLIETILEQRDGVS